MSLDDITITKEELELYSLANKKEGLINTIRAELPMDHLKGAICGSGAIGFVMIPVYELASGIYGRDILSNSGFALLGLCAAVVTIGIVREIRGKYRNIRAAEAELNQIKQDPRYKKLDSIMRGYCLNKD